MAAYPCDMIPHRKHRDLQCEREDTRPRECNVIETIANASPLAPFVICSPLLPMILIYTRFNTV